MKKAEIKFQAEVFLFGAFIILNCIYPMWYYPSSVAGKFVFLNS